MFGMTIHKQAVEILLYFCGIKLIFRLFVWPTVRLRLWRYEVRTWLMGDKDFLAFTTARTILCPLNYDRANFALQVTNTNSNEPKLFQYAAANGKNAQSRKTHFILLFMILGFKSSTWLGFSKWLVSCCFSINFLPMRIWIYFAMCYWLESAYVKIWN